MYTLYPISYIQVDRGRKDHETMLAFIDGVPLLASLGSHERDVLVSAFKRVEFEEGEAIIHEGDTEVHAYVTRTCLLFYIVSLAGWLLPCYHAPYSALTCVIPSPIRMHTYHGMSFCCVLSTPVGDIFYDRKRRGQVHAERRRGGG